MRRNASVMHIPTLRNVGWTNLIGSLPQLITSRSLILFQQFILANSILINLRVQASQHVGP
jgi:hypothetical protein